MKQILKTYKLLGLAVVLGLCLLAQPPAARGQAPPPEKKMDELEKQVQALKQAIDELRQGRASRNSDSDEVGPAEGPGSTIRSAGYARRRLGRAPSGEAEPSDREAFT